MRLLQKIFCENKTWGEENVLRFQIFRNCKNRYEDLLAYCQHLTALHADLNQRIEEILHFDIPDWVLNPFARGQTQIPDIDESILIQEQLIELSTNEELKPMFEQIYYKVCLQKRYPHFISFIMGYCTKVVDCPPVFLFGRAWIQCRYEPHHKQKKPAIHLCLWGFAFTTYKN